MFGLAKIENVKVKMTLQEGIDELRKYGRPSMMCHDDGTWSCRNKMVVVSNQTSFEIKSGYHHRTLLAAVGATVNNMHKALKDMEVGDG